MEKIAVLSQQGKFDVVAITTAANTLMKTFTSGRARNLGTAFKAAREWAEKQGYTVKVQKPLTKQPTQKELIAAGVAYFDEEARKAAEKVTAEVEAIKEAA